MPEIAAGYKPGLRFARFLQIGEWSQRHASFSYQAPREDKEALGDSMLLYSGVFLVTVL